MNMNKNKNELSERNVQAEHSNASANNAIVDDSDSAAASNELDALRAALQRTQQALAKAEHEVEQLRTQAADIHVDTITATTTDSIKDSHKDADADNTTNGLDSHDSHINGTENGTGTGTGNGTQGKLTEQGREPVAQLTLESDSYGDDMNMNAKEKAAAVSERHLQLQYELADARAETAALNEQLVAAREALALQRKPQPQLLVLADSSTLNAFTTDQISAASITADETDLANANTNA
jgi:transglutaminase/protease-like cytokinesis protein 3